MFIWSDIFLIIVNEIQIISSHHAEFSYPAFFKLAWLTSAIKYTDQTSTLHLHIEAMKSSK